LFHNPLGPLAAPETHCQTRKCVYHCGESVRVKVFRVDGHGGQAATGQKKLPGGKQDVKGVHFATSRPKSGARHKVQTRPRGGLKKTNTRCTGERELK